MTTQTTTQTMPYKCSGPINIEKKKVYQYGLTENNFDPDKSSPPNSWTKRLKKRIYIHCALNISDNDNTK